MLNESDFSTFQKTISPYKSYGVNPLDLTGFLTEPVKRYFCYVRIYTFILKKINPHYKCLVGQPKHTRGLLAKWCNLLMYYFLLCVAALCVAGKNAITAAAQASDLHLDLCHAACVLYGVK